MSEHRKPDFILFIVIEGKNGEKSQWVRFGAAWKASKGYSLKVEPSFRLFPPFNNPRAGLSLMPYEERGRGRSDDDYDDEGHDPPAERGPRRGGRH